MKKIIIWLFKDFAYRLYDMAEHKFTLHIGSIIIVKSYSPSTIPVGGTSTMTLSITSVNSTSASFTDTYPTGVENAAVPNMVNPLGGTVSGENAGEGDAPNPLSVFLGTIGLNETVEFKINVTSNTVGQYTNTITDGLMPTSAILTVIAAKKKRRTARFGILPTIYINKENLPSPPPVTVPFRGYIYAFNYSDARGYFYVSTGKPINQ